MREIEHMSYEDIISLKREVRRLKRTLQIVQLKELSLPSRAVVKKLLERRFSKVDFYESYNEGTDNIDLLI